MEKKHFNNISKECEGIFNYVSPKIKIDEEWYIKVIENIGKGEILMKDEEVYEAFGFNQPTILNIIGKPLKKGNAEFIDNQTIQAIKDIKKGGIIIFSEDGKHKPLLFRAPNIIVYILSFVMLSLFLCFLSMGFVVCGFYLYNYFSTN